MAITVSALENMNLPALEYVQDNFHISSYWFGSGDLAFRTGAKGPVESGAAWTGTGQPEAVTTLEINRSGMEISFNELSAASNAVEALRVGLKNARDVVLAEKAAAPSYVKIQEDGQAIIDPDQNPVLDGPKVQEVHRISRTVIGALVYAIGVDKTAADLLGQIGSHSPTYSDTADAGAARYNQQRLEESLDDLGLSATVLAFWEKTYPEPIPEDAYFRGSDWIEEHGGTILDLILTGSSLIPAVWWVKAALGGLKAVVRAIPPPTRTEPKAPAPPKKEEQPPLENAKGAKVDEGKFSRYSMDPAKNDKNNGKWKAWQELGYDVNNAEARSTAADSIARQVRQELPHTPARNRTETPYGTRFETEHQIVGPNGNHGTLVIVWQYDKGSSVPRQITNWVKVHK